MLYTVADIHREKDCTIYIVCILVIILPRHMVISITVHVHLYAIKCLLGFIQASTFFKFLKILNPPKYM